MTTFLLIRHAAHELLNRTLAGRMPGVHLSAAGQAQAVRLAERLAPLPITAVYSSPSDRARETAEPVARRLGLPVEIAAALDEHEFGAWTGRPFDELREQPGWRPFNTYRSGTRPPGGELHLEVQTRAVAWLTAQQATHPDAVLACISHGDVIKATLLYYLGASLDFVLRLDIGPASVSVLELREWGPKIHRMNDTGGPLLEA
jgi:probable phosphoglycerate mutase